MVPVVDTKNKTPEKAPGAFVFEVLARDGMRRHYVSLRVPLVGMDLDPRKNLAA